MNITHLESLGAPVAEPPPGSSETDVRFTPQTEMVQHGRDFRSMPKVEHQPPCMSRKQHNEG
jgi:hypothetical protein